MFKFCNFMKPITSNKCKAQIVYSRALNRATCLDFVVFIKPITSNKQGKFVYSKGL